MPIKNINSIVLIDKPFETVEEFEGFIKDFYGTRNHSDYSAYAATRSDQFASHLTLMDGCVLMVDKYDVASIAKERDVTVIPLSTLILGSSDLGEL